MEHEEIRLKLAAYLDNAVSEQDKVEIKKHLGMCGVCRGEIADLELTVKYLKSLPEVEPPSWLPQKVMAKISEEDSHRRSLWRKIFFPLYIKVPIEVLAILFVCILAYNLTGPEGGHPTLPERRKAPLSTERQPHASNESGTPGTAPSGLSKGRGVFKQVDRSPLDASTQRPAEGIPALPLKQETPAPQAKASPRRAVEPELQPVDSGFMSERETPLGSKEGKVAAAGKAAKKGKSTSGEKVLPAAGSLPVGNGEIVLEVDDPASASGAIEEAVTRLGGRINGRSNSGNAYFLSIRIGAGKIKKLADRLGQLGKVKEAPQIAGDAGGVADVVIRW